VDIAAALSTILFFVFSMVQVVAAALTFSYAGYSFFTAFVNTAAGSDEVVWPGEPIQDWIGKGWYLVWLLAVWAVPATLLAGLFSPSLWLYTLIVVGMLWLVFPVTLLSSLSAESRLVILRPTILRRLGRRWLALLIFYPVTALLLAVCVVLFYYAVLGPIISLPGAAFVGGVSFLIYARLLGRIGWLISQDEEEEEAEEEALAPAGGEAAAVPVPPSPTTTERSERRRARAYDPWGPPGGSGQASISEEAPATAHDPYAPTEETYGVMEEDKPRAPPLGPRPPEPDLAPGLGGATSDGPSRAREQAAPTRRQLGDELAIMREVPPAPRWPLLQGVYTFPFYRTTWGPLFVLTFGFLCVATLLRAQIVYLPPEFGEIRPH
jgi:hypothetical protein